MMLRVSPAQLRHGAWDKVPLRRATADYLPEWIRWRGKHGTFDQLVERALGGMEYARLDALFRGSKLSERGLVDDVEFRRALGGYSPQSKRTREVGGLASGSPLIWRTIAAESWLRARGE